MSWALGLDFGTGAVRASLVSVESGETLASAAAAYHDGVLAESGNPDLARQRPLDWLDAMAESVQRCLAKADKHDPAARDAVVGIGVDHTGSSPLPVGPDAQPIARGHDSLAAQCWLWKDHTSFREAQAITEVAARQTPNYVEPYGGTYSSEWFWAKAWRFAIDAPDLAQGDWHWVEASDWLVAFLTGVTDSREIKRNACAAGHKGMAQPRWGGYPPADFWAELHPELGRLRSRMPDTVHRAGTVAGHLAPEIAQELGLRAGIPVAVGALDAHAGAVGSGVQPGTLVKIMGTSTCDILVHPGPMDRSVPGLSGDAWESVLDGHTGIEAGQSAVGDLFDWFVRTHGGEWGDRAHEVWTDRALALRPGESGLLALDWNNGNRCILVDARLRGLILGQSLATQPHEVYRALVESTAFGAARILRQLREHGVKVEAVRACGGIAQKNPLVMQVYADVLEMPVRVIDDAETCARGAAIFGAVAGGAHESLQGATAAMASPATRVYEPAPAASRTYAELQGLYDQVHDAFGITGHVADLSGVMKRLLEIQEAASRG